MNPELQNTLIATVLTMLGGIFGYIFREYRNRAKPFIAISSIEGGTHEAATEVLIPEATVETIKKSFLIRELLSTDTIDEIQKSRSNADSVIKNTDRLQTLIDKFLEASLTQDTSLLQNALSKILEMDIYQQWLIALFANDLVNIPKVNEELPIVIPVYSSHEEDGSVWIAFQGSPTSYGKYFEKTPILKEKNQPVIALIERLDVDNLRILFKEVKRIIEKELSHAKDVKPILDEIIDENSKWMFEIYIANLGKTAFLVSTVGKLHVYDETGANFEENCDLVLISKSTDGTSSRDKTGSPLVVGGEKDVMFAYATVNSQKLMKRGKAFRDAFVSGSAQCLIEFELEKVGLIRKTTVRTPKTIFKATK